LPTAVLLAFGIALVALRQHPGEDDSVRRLIARLFGYLMVLLGLLWLVGINLPQF
jgi:hypothetical protein